MTVNKKIIFTVTTDLNYDQRMMRISGSLHQAGYSVELIGREKKDSKTLISTLYRQKRLQCFFQKGKFFYIEYNIRLFFYLIFKRYDAVCAIDLDTILAVYSANLFHRKILVYDAHEYFTELPELVERPFTKRIWEWVGRFTIPKVKAAYTVGTAIAGALSKKYSIPFETIRNVPLHSPINASKIGERLAKSPKILLYQGALNEGRGIEQMIEAMQQLKTKAVLWLAGEGDLSAVLRKKALLLGLNEDSIKFWGYLRPDELKTLTEQAFLGINLLENKGLNYYFSLANKYFDYMQMGIPSLNMNFPEYKNLNDIYQTSVLLENLDTATIVRAVETLIENENIYQKLANNALETAKILNWEEEEKKLLKIYETLFNA